MWGTGSGSGLLPSQGSRGMMGSEGGEGRGVGGQLLCGKQVMVLVNLVSSQSSLLGGDMKDSWESLFVSCLQSEKGPHTFLFLLFLVSFLR